MKLPFLDKLKLAQKLTLVLVTIFTIAIIVSASFIGVTTNNIAKQEISSKAMMLLAMIDSTRDYTNSQIEPKLREQSNRKFISQTIPAFAVHNIFETLQKNPEYREFIYREAALNPTNINDRADLFEAKLIAGFRTAPELKEQTGFTNSSNNQGEVFYIARPTRITQSSCLQCHGKPEDAPKSMVAKYGSKNGFGWKLNDVIGAQIISVPSDHILTNARNSFLIIIALILSIFGLTIAMVNVWIQGQVVKPVINIARTVAAISMGENSSRLNNTRRDEIGVLAQAIDRLSTSLEISIRRNKKLK